MSGTIGFVSLGCPKATVDSERIISQLRAEDYTLCNDYYDADLVIINTCGFIDEAVAESLETISEALEENGQVIVTGCLGAQADKIRAQFPDVLAVTGPAALEAVMNAVHEHLPPDHDPHLHLLPPGGIKLTPRHYAYMKIAEGCNQRCSFCIIPSMRGKLISRPIGEVLDEAERLVGAGVKELLIVAQDTAAYGVDIKYRSGFWQGQPVKSSILELSRHLGQLGAWVRLHYIYPYPHVDKLVELMAEGVILPYLDVPLQHAVPRILKNMRRPADSENMLRRINHWREVCPDITLRSTFIVGFPGETDDDFQQLLDFIEAAQLDKVGAFPYSPVAGAAANALADAVDEDIKLERLEEFMALQSQISAEKLQRQIDKVLPVIVDGFDEEEGQLVARTQGDAPEIDGLVIIENVENPESITAGDILRVRIVDANEHDLYAVLDG